MKRIVLGILCFGVILAGCATFDDPAKPEDFGNGPSISINIGAKTDSAFTFTITPGSGAVYYSYIIAQSNTAQELDALSLLRGVYSGGVIQDTLITEKLPTFTFDMIDKDGEPMCSPNTTYQIYAVASNVQGIVGNVVNQSVTTTDTSIPAPYGVLSDGAKKSVSVAFNENIKRGEGVVTAKSYKEWDFDNAITLEEDEFTVEVSENTVLFTAPDAPAGAYVTFTWAEGAFVDAVNNPCEAFSNVINANGIFINSFVHVNQVPFDIEESCTFEPELASNFRDWEAFVGELIFDFPIFIIEDDLKAGDIKITYTNAKKTTVINLPVDYWEVDGNTLRFALTESPQIEDYVGIQISEGILFDVYGNPNEAFELEEGWIYFAEYERSMVIGTYIMAWDSYFGDGPAEAAITIEADPDSDDGVIISGLFSEFAGAGLVPIEGVFEVSEDGESASISIPDEQVVYDRNGTLVYYVNAGVEAPVTWNVLGNSNMYTDDLWGYYIETPDDDGWYDAAYGATFTKMEIESSLKSAKQSRKIDFSNLKLRTSPNLRRR